MQASLGLLLLYCEGTNRKLCCGDRISGQTGAPPVRQQQTWRSTARRPSWRRCCSSRRSQAETFISADRARSRPEALAFPRTPYRTRGPVNPPSPPCTPGRCSGSSTVSPEVTAKCSRSTLEPSASCTRTSASRAKTIRPPPSTGVLVT